MPAFRSRWLENSLETGKTPTDNTDKDVSVCSVSAPLARFWAENQALQAVTDTIEAVSTDHGGAGYNTDEFHSFDAELATSFEAQDIDAVRTACREYRQAVDRRLGTIPQAGTIIEAHGERFVVIPDAEPPERWAHLGAPLTASEVCQLAAGSGGQPLDAEMVRAIAATKKHFPEATIESARDFRPEPRT